MEGVIEVPLADEERGALMKSAKAVQGSIQHLKL